MDDYKKIAIKAAMVGAINGFGTSMLFGSGNINFLGGQYSATIPYFVSGAGSSLAADLAHNYVFPLIPNNAKWGNLESAALGSSAAAAANVGIIALTTGLPRGSYIPVAIGGAVSYAAGSYINDYALKDNKGAYVFA